MCGTTPLHLSSQAPKCVELLPSPPSQYPGTKVCGTTPSLPPPSAQEPKCVELHLHAFKLFLYFHKCH